MIRLIYAVTIVVILATGVPYSSAQPPPATPNSQPALDEAEQLSELVVKLYGEGKFQEAVAPAERGLALREKALGPTHPDVAISLNNLALLYHAQGAYGKAEPLYVRALAILEKALGPMHPGVASSLNNLAEFYRAQGAYGKAEPLYLRALDVYEKALGPTHPKVATSLNNLAALYQTQGAYGKAELLYARALDIAEKALGLTHPELAKILSNLAVFYQAQGAYGKAEPLYVRALDILEKALGPTHPAVATSLNNFAALYWAQGAYGKAEPLLLRALDVYEKALGPTHPLVATSLNNLAELYWAQGAYGKVEPLFVRALAINEKALGPTHSDVATNLNNLAKLYSAQGAYGKAEPLYVRALAINEKALGPTHATVAISLNNLAELYRTQSAYGKSEPLYVRAVTINEKALGPTHPQVAISLNNLALLYSAQGAYGKAEPLYGRALDIREKLLGPTHPDVANSLNSLAWLYSAQGAYGKAEPLCIRALDIREKLLGPTHPDVANSLNNLALLYSAQGAYGKAEPLYIRALAINEKALGPTHPDVAVSLNNLAWLYSAQGAYGKAEPLYVGALDVLERALGSTHPDVATILNNLALLYQTQDAYGKAEPLVARAADIQEQQLRTELPRLSELRKRALMALLQGVTDWLISLQADAMPSSTPALELAFTTVLRRKGRILDSLLDSETRLRTHLTPGLRDQLDQLSHARTDLIKHLYAPAGPRGDVDLTAVATTRARIDDLESKLSAASAEFRAETEPVTMAKIQAALPRGAALVEFVRYQRFDPRQAQQPWQEERYVAYLVLPRGPPQWVALGAAVPIDAEIDAVLAAMNRKAATETAKAALGRLDALVFAPIRARLPGVSHVILAPDGKLNLVSFEALVDPQGHYALENYLVSYVTMGRDLLRLAATQPPRSPAVIVASPDYDPSPPARPGAVSFAPLDGAAGEAMDLRRYFPTSLLGEDAKKSALAALTGPAMLHIATHGFYARDPGPSSTHAASPLPTPRALPALAPLAERDPLRGMFVDLGASLRRPPLADDPADALDRAGLAMAGANQGPGGIVTAREIAGFDWWGTQLVVLSACETGVGAVPSGDGVYGLRRALVLAGAASQVVSLWSVSDASTRALMRDYYGELARGTGRAEALRRAQLRQLRQPRYEHPYYWAAFIPAGDWRPLDRHTMHRP
jgi:tetratricopeptide (TPR) repeat protein/CHAT domain-containing protein